MIYSCWLFSSFKAKAPQSPFSSNTSLLQATSIHDSIDAALKLDRSSVIILLRVFFGRIILRGSAHKISKQDPHKTRVD